jgi:hypothetical protein
MSRAKNTGDIEPTDEGRGIDWLERNATLLPISDLKDTDSWDRAGEQRRDAEIQPLDSDDLFRVKLPDGDPHLVLMVRNTDNEKVGACSCEGYRYNDHCAHLLTLAMLDVTEQYVRLQDMRAAQLRSDPVDAEIIDHSDQEDVLDAGDDRDDREDDHGDDPSPQEPEVVESTTKDVPDTQGSTGENQPADPSTKAFAGELPDVGKEYVMEMGGETYIRRAGYARLARAEGFRLTFEEIVGAHETDWTHSKYWVRVVNEDGEHIAEDVGTAGPPDAEDMSDAESNLDELAATRAATRALAWATGEGLNAVAEVAEQQTERIE